MQTLRVISFVIFPDYFPKFMQSDGLYMKAKRDGKDERFASYLQLNSHLLWEQGVGSSNLSTPTVENEGVRLSLTPFICVPCMFFTCRVQVPSGLG